MVALAVTVLLGVTFRFAGSALVWYDEVAAVQLAWITYYGSAYAALKGSHISVPSLSLIHISEPTRLLSIGGCGVCV